MIEDKVIDYAYPCMMAEAALKATHNAALHNKYDEAIEAATTAITELRIVIASLKIMKDDRG
jgi:hypothetical protein